MEIIKRLAKFRKILGIALIAIPWFFRDQVATTFDIAAQNLNSVQMEMENQEQEKSLAKQQKAIVDELAAHKLELLKLKNPESQESVEQLAEELFQETLKQEGTDLVQSATTLRDFKQRVNLEPDKAKEIEDSANSAQQVGEYLQNGHTADANLFKVWEAAEINLNESYKTILEQAKTESKSSSGLASTARFIAWLFTAIGALVVGDWRSLIGGFMGGDDQQGTQESDGTAPQ
ncbi:MAG: hypothetical protein JNK38_26780 [Acidobacteria bacterium]|nr:hypothetical protein [Acidobacteriota bacterium]